MPRPPAVVHVAVVQMDLGPLGGRFPFNPPLVREGAELGSIPTHSRLEDPMCGRLGKGGPKKKGTKNRT